MSTLLREKCCKWWVCEAEAGASSRRERRREPKVSESTNALETLGTIIDASAGRDAIHLAVEPSIAAHPLRPGDHVGFIEGGVGICEKPVGIVDPFLKSPVLKGQWFWLVVYPRQITSLRHVWTHPEFRNAVPSAHPVQNPTSKENSEGWLRRFCTESDCPKYERVMELIEKGTISGEYGDSYMDEEFLHFNGSDAHGAIPPEFWEHVEVVTGKKIPADGRPKYFSCSC